MFIALNIFLALFITQFFLLDFGTVSGPSMTPSFCDGETLVIVKAPLFFRPPQRFEVVQMTDPQYRDSLVIKRVIGLPGETVAFHQNRVCVTPKGSSKETCLNEPYLLPRTVSVPRAVDTYQWHVPDGWYFVLGDNRTNSFDSRDYGPVPRELILGVAVPL